MSAESPEMKQRIEQQIQKCIGIAREFVIPNYGHPKYHLAYLGYRLPTHLILKDGLSTLNEGLSVSQVKDLEEQLGLSLPPSLVEFMLITGSNWSDIISSEVCSEKAEHLLELQRFPGEFIDDFYEVYPNNIFIIGTESYGQQTIYFKKDEFFLEDPLIYRGEVVCPNVQGSVQAVDYREHKLGVFSEFTENHCRYLISQKSFFRHY